jgi:hypothetical protein
MVRASSQRQSGLRLSDFVADQDVTTQITVAEAEEGKQNELLALMSEHGQVHVVQPGFSSSLHRSLDLYEATHIEE